MYEPVGTVDHFVNCNADEMLAYDWRNYRFASQWINSSKQDCTDELLDPLRVGSGWFKIILPSLQLVATDRIPAAKRRKAEHTLKRLHLDHDERVVRQRRQWYRLYQEGSITLDGLRKMAPLIAEAVQATS